jgi:hypothetical protein
LTRSETVRETSLGRLRNGWTAIRRSCCTRCPWRLPGVQLAQQLGDQLTVLLAPQGPHQLCPRSILVRLKSLIGQRMTSWYFTPSSRLTKTFNQAMTSVTLGRFRVPAPQLYLIAGASLVGLLFLRHVSSSLRDDKFKTCSSPKETTLPRLSGDELGKLPYHPNALPGARDVDSPYGSIRVYEWGPEDGEKILLIHGISTPSIALTDLAYRLVEKGCRVMLFGMLILLHVIRSLDQIIDAPTSLLQRCLINIYLWI